MKKRLLFMLLTLLCFIGGARAQQALPYSYGFETALANDGWIANVTSTNSGIKQSATRTGTYGFSFYYSEQNGSLISPVLTGGVYGVDVSFWYKEYADDYGDEQFYVGYTTDENETNPSNFTYGEIVTASTSWQEYTNTFPAGTKRIAIKYVYNNAWFLYLDDFSFEAASVYAKPVDLTVDDVATTTATISWTKPKDGVTGYKYQYKPIGGEWTTLTSTTGLSVNLTGLTVGTAYTFQVQAIYDGGESDFASVNFTTDCPESYAVPYAYGFENTGGINCWTIIGENYTNAYDNDWANDNLGGSFSRTGNNFFFFFYTENPPQYLISPQLSGIENGLHVEFYYRQYTNGVETFQVGYSTTDNNPASFTWGEEITASTSYQRFSANYPAGTKYVAVKHTSDDQYYLFVDDFLFEESASVLEPTGVTASNATTTSASISWTAGGTETSWDLYVTSDNTDVPDESTVPTVVGTSSNPYALTGLTPATYYYVYVRANTGAETSAWSSPAIFNTMAEPIDLPYSYGFEDTNLPIGWNIINTNTSYNAVNIMKPSNSSDNKVLSFYIGTYTEANLVAVLPEVDAAYPLKGYQITFDACYAQGSNGGMTSGKLRIGIMTDPTDFETFTMIKEVDITDGYNTSDSQLGLRSHTVYLNHYTGNGQYIAIQDVRTQNGYVLVDNVSVTELPDCIPPTDLEVTATTSTTATISWTINDIEDEWQVCLNGDEENLITTYENPFTLTGLTASTAYTVKVRACIDEKHSEWSDEVNFTTDPAPITSFPWTEDFNSLTEAYSIPAGWNNDEGTITDIAYKWCYNTYTSGNGATNGTSHDNSNCVRFNSYTPDNGLTNFLKTLPLVLPASPNMQLTFWYKNPAGGDFSVYISTDGGITHETALATGLTGVSSWTQIDPIDLSAYAGQEVVIVFKGTSNWGSGDAYIYLDDVTVEEISSINITMNEHGIMTYASPYKLDFSSVSGLTAYAATSISGVDLTMTPVNVAPAEAGLMLKGTANANFSVPVTTADADDLTDNKLVGLVKATLVPVHQGDYTTYILANGADGVNWYELEADYTLKANSAYLKLTSAEVANLGAGARGFNMIFDDGTTAIHALQSAAQETENGAWYTLQGLRLDKQPTTKGIYIHNGRKVVIK